MNPKGLNIITTILILLFFSVSCENSDNPGGENDILTEKLTYNGQALESNTNGNGKLEIRTKFNGVFIYYKVKVINDRGEAVEDATVVYNQVNGKSVFFIKDHFNRYNSAFFYGTPDELFDKFSLNINGKKQEGSMTEGAIQLTIGLIGSVSSLTESKVESFDNAHYVNQFYISGSSEESKDYDKYCKDFYHVAKLIKSRSENLSASSILISLEIDGSREIIEISSDILVDNNTLKDNLIAKAMDYWDLSQEELAGCPLSVKCFFSDQDEKFINVETAFLYIEISKGGGGCENFIYGVPDEVNGFLSIDFIEMLEHKGLEVNRGLVPPNVEGIYYVDSWANFETGTKYLNYTYRFDKQSEDLTIEVESASDQSNAIASAAFISGEGNNFSIYSEGNHTIDDMGSKIYIKTADIYSGTITSDGIVNFKSGFIIIEKENDINNNFLAVGDLRIIHEIDDLAEKVSSFPFNMSGGRVAEAYLENDQIFSN